MIFDDQTPWHVVSPSGKLVPGREDREDGSPKRARGSKNRSIGGEDDNEGTGRLLEVMVAVSNLCGS